METFELDGRPFVALCDLLKLTGSCSSGGHAKQVIAAGEVKVDGQVELRKRCKIRSGRIVEYGTERLKVV
ncbi:MAG: RNA-binding S4 domain-containing protein [Pelovirga sp.]